MNNGILAAVKQPCWRICMACLVITLAGCSAEPPPLPPKPKLQSALRVLPVGSESTTRLGDVVFIHGLEGHEIDTWSSDPSDPEMFWPKWVAKEFPEVGVWSVRYNARISEWEGGSMAFQDRAKSVLELLRLKKIGTNKPVIFVVHSLGGIVTKQMLRTAAEGSDKRWKTFTTKSRGIVFLATPHTGSNLGAYLEKLATALDVKDVARPTDLSHQLRANAPELRDLNEWYRGNAQRLHVETRALYETEDFIPGHKVVDEGPSDPAIPGLTADPVDATHISISKPVSRDDPVYMSVVEFVGKYLTPDEPWDITLLDFSELFNKSRRDERLQAFNKDYGGKRVKWKGIVRSIYPPKDQPGWTAGYSIAVSTKSPSTDWVLASFDPDLFRESVKVGDEIAIEGRVGRDNNTTGARLNECSWQDSSR